jgi:hypothetical protein
MDMEEGWWSSPPEEQARRVTGDLESSSGRWWSSAGISDGQWGAAQVCRMRPARILHVVGTSEMAEHLREIYDSGEIAGWSLQPMPATRTPLHSYLEALVAAGPQPGSMRGYNQLDRHGFVFAEEVQVCPDQALLEMRNFGQIALAAVREVLGPAPTIPAGESAFKIRRLGKEEGVSARQRYLADRLTAPAATRYRDFVQLLAQSQIPLAALDKICTALSSEPVPPADPLVTLLLDTAGESGLLDLYRATHSEDDG